MFPNEMFWAIAPTHVDAVMQQLAATIQMAIQAGPVDDAQRAALPVSRNGTIATVSLKGPMLKDAGIWRFYGWASSIHTQRAIQAADADDDIDTIVLDVDTPGGSVAGLEGLSNAVAATSKPIIAQSTGMIASAGYHVVSQADAIYAENMDLIGSIGVRTVMYDYSKAFEEAGIRAVPIDTGEHKSTGIIGAPITDEQEAEIQRVIDGYMDEFVGRIVSGRSMTEEQVRAVGDGRVFFAEESVGLGLIDGVQTMEETLESLTPRRTAESARRALKQLEFNESR